MISEIVLLKKQVAELEAEARTRETTECQFEIERRELLKDVAYWKEEANQAMEYKTAFEDERQRRNQLKAVFDDTHKELKKTQKHVGHLRVDRTSSEKARNALQNKCRILQHEAEVTGKQRDAEQDRRKEAEAKADATEKRFNDERANRLKGLHQMNREQMKAFEAERKEREALLKTIETCRAASQLTDIIQGLEFQVESNTKLLEYQYRELQAYAKEVEGLKRDALKLRKVIKEKEEVIVKKEYKAMETQKECWRIQREAIELVNTTLGGSRRGGTRRDVLLTKPSLLQTKIWKSFTLNKVIAEHRREGMLLNQAIITNTCNLYQSFSSPSSSSSSDLAFTSTTASTSSSSSNNSNSKARKRPSLRLPWDEKEDEPGGSAGEGGGYNSSKFFTALPLVTVCEPGSPSRTKTMHPSPPPHQHQGEGRKARRIHTGADLMTMTAPFPHHQQVLPTASTTSYPPASSFTTTTSTASSPAIGETQQAQQQRKSTLRVNGSLYVGVGLGLKKPEDDYFASFSGSPRQMVTRASQGFDDEEEE